MKKAESIYYFFSSSGGFACTFTTADQICLERTNAFCLQTRCWPFVTHPSHYKGPRCVSHGATRAVGTVARTQGRYDCIKLSSHKAPLKTPEFRGRQQAASCILSRPSRLCQAGKTAGRAAPCPERRKAPSWHSSCLPHVPRQLDLWMSQATATLPRQPWLSTRNVHFCCLRNIKYFVWSNPVSSLYRPGSVILFSCPTEAFQQHTHAFRVPAAGSCRYRHTLAFFTWMVPAQVQIIPHRPEAYLLTTSRTPASIPILLSIIIC